jgi:hypothetical protein
MHLSHLNLDIRSWYGKSYAERVQRIKAPTDLPGQGVRTSHWSTTCR